MKQKLQRRRRRNLWPLFPLMITLSHKCHAQNDNGGLAGVNSILYCSAEESKNDDMTILVG